MYDGVITNVKTIKESMIRFQLQKAYIKITLSPHLLALVVDDMLSTFRMSSRDICYSRTIVF